MNPGSRKPGADTRGAAAFGGRGPLGPGLPNKKREPEAKASGSRFSGRFAPRRRPPVRRVFHQRQKEISCPTLRSIQRRLDPTRKKMVTTIRRQGNPLWQHQPFVAGCRRKSAGSLLRDDRRGRSPLQPNMRRARAFFQGRGAGAVCFGFAAMVSPGAAEDAARSRKPTPTGGNNAWGSSAVKAGHTRPCPMHTGAPAATAK